jgi:ribosome biogenesis SPOUT family RNA methylase Rps3
MVVYIIEHLEPKVWKWCILEYEHISEIVGKGNLWITNVKEGGEKMKDYARVFHESVVDMDLDWKRVCILDPEADKILKASDAKIFDYYVFGGILGDYPPKKRTKEELTVRFSSNSGKRNIGKEQFPTDNAVYVVKEIVSGKEFEDMKFIEGVSIKVDKVMDIEMPFRYASVNGKPLMGKKLRKYIIDKGDSWELE